jgi:hypothetical protein
MTQMIRCDKCKKLMYADSRSEKGAYAFLQIDYTDGHSSLHLCRICHRQFLTEFIRELTPEEYDDEFGSCYVREE